MLQSTGSQRVGCSLATEQQQHRPTSPVRIQLVVLSLGLPPKAEKQWDSGSEWQGLATPPSGSPAGAAAGAVLWAARRRCLVLQKVLLRGHGLSSAVLPLRT